VTSGLSASESNPHLVRLDERVESVGGLDEPSVAPLLLASLKYTYDSFVEIGLGYHKPEAIAIADQVLDLDPGAGIAGGEVLVTGAVTPFSSPEPGLNGPGAAVTHQ
jgi:excinuclease UvrABC ATPase subunit